MAAPLAQYGWMMYIVEVSFMFRHLPQTQINNSDHLENATMQLITVEWAFLHDGMLSISMAAALFTH